MTDIETIELPTERMIARIEGAVGWMIFNNPARRNAVSLDMWAAVPTIMDRFEADQAVRVIVLRGEGEKAFVAGADISQFEQERSSPETIAHYHATSREAGLRLERTEKPTIAMIRGFCIGGGVGLAAGCDLRIAAEDARFGIPAARLGLGYGAEGVQRLMNLVGPAYTREIFYTARQFTAAEAEAMGFVNRVVPVAELEAYVRSYCDMIAGNAPLTLKALKRTVAELSRPTGVADRALCEELVRACFDSEDYVEGRRAFMEKRKPVFKGR
jgi:enoyl-CoA hydratase/carnithine racemase